MSESKESVLFGSEHLSSRFFSKPETVDPLEVDINKYVTGNIEFDIWPSARKERSLNHKQT